MKPITLSRFTGHPAPPYGGMGLRENIIAYLCGAFAGGCFFCVSQDLHLWLLLNDAYHPRVGLQKMLHITQELVFCLWLLLSVAYYTRLGLLTASSALIRVSSPTRPWLHILLEVIKHAAKKGKNSPKVKCNIHALSLSLWSLAKNKFFPQYFLKTRERRG